jgi:hypothetical protein
MTTLQCFELIGVSTYNFSKYLRYLLTNSTGWPSSLSNPNQQFISTFFICGSWFLMICCGVVTWFLAVFMLSIFSVEFFLFQFYHSIRLTFLILSRVLFNIYAIAKACQQTHLFLLIASLWSTNLRYGKIDLILLFLVTNLALLFCCSA